MVGVEVRKVVSPVETTRREMGRRHDQDDVDGVSVLWFDSRADFDTAYATALGKRVAADSMAHVSSSVRMFVDERSIVGA